MRIIHLTARARMPHFCSDSSSFEMPLTKSYVTDDFSSAPTAVRASPILGASDEHVLALQHVELLEDIHHVLLLHQQDVALLHSQLHSPHLDPEEVLRHPQVLDFHIRSKSFL